MNERRWIRIATLDSVPVREGRTAVIGDRQIALFNLGDRFLAIDNRCPHRGGPLADGIVSANAVVCPLHAWKVCLDTGETERPPDARACVRTYATRIEAGTVWIELPDAGLHADA